MTLLIAFAFIGGTMTILSPCILPVVPFVIGSATGPGRRRIAGILIGFGLTFMATTVVFAAALAHAGLTTDRLRLGAAVLLGLFGFTLVVPAAGRWFERHATTFSELGTKATRRGPVSGLGRGLVLGAAIGLVWAPCVGPIMAAVLASAVAAGPSVDAVLIAVAYVAGVSVPLLALAVAGRRTTRAIGNGQIAARLQRVFGVAMLVAALTIATRLDIAFQTRVADLLPADWSGALVAIEQRPEIEEELEVLESGSKGSVPLDDLGQAPEVRDIAAWINSEPLTLAELRGKVVLVHFWTFGCINCIHVRPYVKAWYERYADSGFVVLGVHTPELSFERDIDNVRDAVRSAEIRFPVAVDSSFGTWRAYDNHYWPAFYFVDRSGHIRHVHFGEGDYEGSERVIRQLLAESAGS
jgi:cytochrome c biogenesis protein CcdA/thiol-disulfide isomerase/thioredoxin